MINRLCLRINPTISNVHMVAAGFKKIEPIKHAQKRRYWVKLTLPNENRIRVSIYLHTDKQVFIFISCRLNNDGERYQRAHKHRGMRVEYQEITSNI